MESASPNPSDTALNVEQLVVDFCQTWQMPRDMVETLDIQGNDKHIQGTNDKRHLQSQHCDLDLFKIVLIGKWFIRL